MPAERRRLQQSDRAQQIDLFDGECRCRRRHGRTCRRRRGMLIGVMVRLILEHAQISSPALRTEARHDD
jgi:hypothetical protein